MTIKGLTLLLKVYKRLAGMCHQSKAATPVAGNSEENINMGLLNISSNSQSIISVETVLETTSFMEMPSAPRAIMAPVGSMEQMGVQPMQPRQSCPEVFTGPIGLDKYR